MILSAEGGFKAAAEAVLVEAGEKGRARRRTHRSVAVEVGKTHTGCGETIEMRSPVDLRPIATEVGVPEIVRENEDDVGLTRLRDTAGKLDDE